MYTINSLRVGSFLGSVSKREKISCSSALEVERGHSLNFRGSIVQNMGNLDQPASSKKYGMPSGRMKTLKNLSLKFLQGVVKELNKTLPDEDLGERAPTDQAQPLRRKTRSMIQDQGSFGSSRHNLNTYCTVPSPGVELRSKSTGGRAPRGTQGRKSTD